MSVLVVGSTAIDTVETPFGKQEAIGGSSTYFGYAAAKFAEVRLVSVVGEDFPQDARARMEGAGIRLEGLEVKPGKTFRWSGKYSPDMNQRETIDVQLNTFGDFKPTVPESYRTSRFVFLANGSPATQASVLDQMPPSVFSVVDTMNLWIEIERPALDELLHRVDGLIVNDEEVRMLTDEHSLIRGGRKLLERGPKLVIVKKGEHGSFLFSNFFQYALPAYPTDQVKDPTGAGDSFAGGFMGYLAGCDSLNVWNMKRAIAYGTVTASFTVEAFGLDGISSVTREDIDRRFEDLVQFVSL